MRPVALRSSLTVPAFLWAVTGTWPQDLAEGGQGMGGAENLDLTAMTSIEREREVDHGVERRRERSRSGARQLTLEELELRQRELEARSVEQLSSQQLELERSQQLEMERNQELELEQSQQLDMELQLDAQALIDATSLDRAPSLSVAMFTDEAEQLWPIEVQLELRRARDGVLVMRKRSTVPDGQRLAFDQVLEVPTGERVVHLEATPRHHPGGQIELDWELQLREAGFSSLEWSDYLQHRFNLAARPAVDAPTLRVVRADIVELGDAPYTFHVDIGDERYTISLRAHDTRG